MTTRKRGVIYIAEDDKEQRSLWEQLLVQHNYEVRSFGTPEAFMEQATKDRGKLHLMLVDMNMTPQDAETEDEKAKGEGAGIEAVYKLRHQDNPVNAPVIFVSASDALQEKVQNVMEDISDIAGTYLKGSRDFLKSLLFNIHNIVNSSRKRQQEERERRLKMNFQALAYRQCQNLIPPAGISPQKVEEITHIALMSTLATLQQGGEQQMSAMEFMKTLLRNEEWWEAYRKRFKRLVTQQNNVEGAGDQIQLLLAVIPQLPKDSPLRVQLKKALEQS